MLRITVLNDAQGATFKMEGKLTNERAAEVEKAWSAFSDIPRQERVVVDLCGVSFVDDPGRKLLTRMHASGAKLIGTGPMSSALIQEICGDDRASGNGWIRTVLSLFFLLPLGCAMTGNNTLAGHERFLVPADKPSAAEVCMVSLHHPAPFTSVPGDKRHVIAPRKGVSR